MGAPRTADGAASGWTIESAESLLVSLDGVIAARIVARPGGRVEEIHLLATDEQSPKRLVRDVESALLAHFDLPVDHRTISIAQTRSADQREAPDSRDLSPVPGPKLEGAAGRAGTPTPHVSPAPSPFGTRGCRKASSRDSPPGGPSAESASIPQSSRPPLKHVAEDHLVFGGHRIETARSGRVRVRVFLDKDGVTYEGASSGTDHPQSRTDALARATVDALEALLRRGEEDPEAQRILSVGSIETVAMAEGPLVLASVSGIEGRRVTRLAGAAPVEGSPERAVISAILQATDSWVRGRT